MAILQALLALITRSVGKLIQLDLALHGARQLLEDAGLEVKKQQLQKGQPMSSAKDDSIGSALNKSQRVTPTSQRAAGAAQEPERRLSETPARALPMPDLISRTLEQMKELGKTQIQLAIAEARADLKAELGAGKGLGIAAWAGLSAIQLLLVAGAFALANIIPGWAAALAVAGVLAVVAGVAGAWGWSRRIRHPMEKTRRVIEEDVQWAKEKIA